MKDVKYKKLHPNAQEPRYATDGAAAADLYAISEAEIPPMFAGTLDTGLAFEIPPGHGMLILSRSGHGFKSGVRLSNCVGLIDSDCRGEVKVRLHNDGNVPFCVDQGDRIAQAIVIPMERINFILAEELSVTIRGGGGFGSTGAK